MTVVLLYDECDLVGVWPIGHIMAKELGVLERQKHYTFVAKLWNFWNQANKLNQESRMDGVLVNWKEGLAGILPLDYLLKPCRIPFWCWVGGIRGDVLFCFLTYGLFARCLLCKPRSRASLFVCWADHPAVCSAPSSSQLPQHFEPLWSWEDAVRVSLSEVFANTCALHLHSSTVLEMHRKKLPFPLHSSLACE